MAQELAPRPSEDQSSPTVAFDRLFRTGASTTNQLAGGSSPIRRTPKGPALLVVVIGVALCGIIASSIQMSDARAKRFAAFVAAQVQKDAASRNIKVITIGEPAGTFEVNSRSPVHRRSKGYMIEANGNRTPYEADSVQVCADPEPTCWKVIRVAYGEPS